MMVKRLISRQRGFTLIELLIVVAIIGLLAAMIVPNMLGALQKAKQKRTMAEERLVGTALMAWLTDHASAAAAGQDTIFSADHYTLSTRTEVASLVVPLYIQEVPEKDGWGNSFEYRFNQVENGQNFAAVRSPGRDGSLDASVYTSGGFPSVQFDRDIIWADGFFVAWPTGVEVDSAP